jgi:hypothetical protein
MAKRANPPAAHEWFAFTALLQDFDVDSKAANLVMPVTAPGINHFQPFTGVSPSSLYTYRPVQFTRGKL